MIETIRSISRCTFGAVAPVELATPKFGDEQYCAVYGFDLKHAERNWVGRLNWAHAARCFWQGCTIKEVDMSIFGKIMGAIFGTQADAATPGTSGGSASGGGSTQSSAGGSNVDVSSILNKAVATKGEKLEWKTSIVDLMKALDIDSSLTARKELAKELGYSGDTNDSATMNVWLHKQVMAKLAANGGKLPADLHHA